MNIGFSTGSLAYGDFNKGINLSKAIDATVIELSALRENELRPLVEALDKIDLSSFEYISFHAPSKLTALSEAECIQLLMKVADYGYHVIVHPDIITDSNLWRSLGKHLCIENMDKRKPIGRTCSDLQKIFARLPEATFCLDVAHARQVDSTMTEAMCMIKSFKDKLVQLHLSDVNSSSHHKPLNLEAILAFRKVSHIMPPDIPIILESPVLPEVMKREISIAELLINDTRMEQLLDTIGMPHPVKYSFA